MVAQPPEYSSPLATRYATAAMVANFADRRRYLLWRDLWIALATAQRELGLAIDVAQIDAMRAHRDELDLARVAEHEARTRHDVMAHVHHFGELVGPGAEKIIHLGATSCFVADNAESIPIASDGPTPFAVSSFSNNRFSNTLTNPNSCHESSFTTSDVCSVRSSPTRGSVSYTPSGIVSS